MKVDEAIARTLVDEGVDAVFTMLGDGSVHIVWHLKELGVPVYECRHEAIAVAMADGYSRATGRFGVAAVTGGPALAHAFVPLTSAARTDTKLILLTGPGSRDAIEGRQVIDHKAVSELTGARFRPIHSPDTAVQRTRDAVDTVLREHVPVVLDVSEETQRLEIGWDYESRQRPAWHEPQRPHPDPALIERVVAMIGSAERPVVLAGRGALVSGARDALVRLGDRLGAVMGTALEARGLFHGEPFDAGVAGLYATDGAARVYGEADLVLAFGASLNGFTLVDGYLFQDAEIVQVDVRSPRSMGSGEPADCYVQGDALAVAEALLAALPDTADGSGFRTDDVAERLRDVPDPWQVEVEPDRLDPRELCARLEELLPDDVGFASGNSGHFWAFPVIEMPKLRDPNVFATYFGAIGYGLSVGVGAAIGRRDRPIVVFDGDAGSMMHIQAVEAAARYGARTLLVVMNDGLIGAEYHNLVSRGYDPSLAFQPPLDISNVARSLGCPAERLTDLDELPRLVKEFLDGDGPLLIDARISSKVISRPSRRTRYGMDV